MLLRSRRMLVALRPRSSTGHRTCTLWSRLPDNINCARAGKLVTKLSGLHALQGDGGSFANGISKPAFVSLTHNLFHAHLCDRSRSDGDHGNRGLLASQPRITASWVSKSATTDERHSQTAAATYERPSWILKFTSAILSFLWCFIDEC